MSRTLFMARDASHERGLRPGTENVPFVVGLGAKSLKATLGARLRSARAR